MATFRIKTDSNYDLLGRTMIKDAKYPESLENIVIAAERRVRVELMKDQLKRIGPFFPIGFFQDHINHINKLRDTFRPIPYTRSDAKKPLY